MATIKKYNGSTWENAVVRKYGTASEIITLPTTIYADGTAITAYTIKGNTVQSGTPTPSNPVAVNGVGERTENLWDEQYLNISSTLIYKPIYVGAGEYTLSTTVGFSDNAAVLFLLAGNVQTGASSAINGVGSDITRTVTAVDGYVTIAYRKYAGYNPEEHDTMLNSGSTAKPYEPYGIKIPISSGGVTTPIYLTEPLMKIGDTVDSLVSAGTATYNIKKLVLTGQESFWVDDGTVDTRSRYRILPTGADTVLRGNRDDLYCTHFKTDLQFSANSVLIYNGTTGVFIYFYVPTADYPTLADFKAYIQQQYANGTPVILYYILATPTTETVTASSIPTTDGANTITVDTTVQPSEFTATWKGWHDSSVKEYDGSDWQ